MKNRNLKYNYNSGLVTLGFKYCFCIYCLTLMPFNLLTFVTGTAFANSDKLVEYKLIQDNLTDSNDSSEQLKRQLWRSDITPTKDENDRKQQDELRQLIEQIRAIEIRPQEQISEPVVVPEILPVAEPNDVSITSEPVTKEKKDFEPNLPYTPISNETLQMLRNLSQNPQQIDNPLELGEVLFRNGDHKEAVLFYKEALKRVGPNDPNAALDRAWLLFQAGNCLRNNNMAEAAKMYGQLITEYPNSLWAGIALIQSQFIAWHQKDEPQKLINENKQQNIQIK